MSDEGFVSLNLSGANLEGGDFQPVPPGWYHVSVFEAEHVEVGGSNGRLPQGTPGIKIQFQVLEEEYYNRRAFTNYWLPPEGYDSAKAAQMQGMLVKLLVALGYDQEEVMSGDFNLDINDLLGRECSANLGKKERVRDGEKTGIWDNTVRGVRPLGVESEDSATALI